jgi:hypothetical protein
VNQDICESGFLSNRKVSMTITFKSFYGSTTNRLREGPIFALKQTGRAANRTSSKQDEQQTGRAANRTSSKQDEQQTGRAANRTTSLPDPFPLTAMMLGQFGLGPLRGPLLTAAFRQIHGIQPLIRESPPFQKMRRW